MTLEQLSHDLRLAKDRKKTLEDDLKDCNAEIKDIEEKLAGAMVDENIDRFSNEYGSFSINVKEYYSPVSGQRETLYEALSEIEPGLVRLAVNPQTLNAFMRERVEDNNGEMPRWAEGLVNVYEKTTINVRRN